MQNNDSDHQTTARQFSKPQSFIETGGGGGSTVSQGNGTLGSGSSGGKKNDYRNEERK